jgi:hypothetical protein
MAAVVTSALARQSGRGSSMACAQALRERRGPIDHFVQMAWRKALRESLVANGATAFNDMPVDFVRRRKSEVLPPASRDRCLGSAAPTIHANRSCRSRPQCATWKAMVTGLLPALAAVASGCEPRATGRLRVAEGSPEPPPSAIRPPDCGDSSAWRQELLSLRPSAVAGIRSTHVVDTCSGTSQVSGTTLILRPESASGSSWRMLQCSSAHVLFSHGEDSWIPSGWVDIEVRREAGASLLTIHAETVSKNIKLLHRASTFAEGR